jgi:peptidoglycan hydrolase CwlO-like protein
MDSIDPSQLFFVQVAGAIATVLGAWLLIHKVIVPIIKSMKNLFNQVDDFMDDWKGSEPRVGREKIPGVMERLNKIDGELSHNGGSSIKDAVQRIESKIEEIDNRLDSSEINLKEIEEHLKEFDKIEEKLDQIDRDIRE